MMTHEPAGRGAARTTCGAEALTSSARWRTERPPIVFDGEIRHWLRIRFTFTRPYLGTASIRSKTFAEPRYSGGSISSALDLHLARLQILLQLRPLRADLVRGFQRPQSLVVGPGGDGGACGGVRGASGAAIIYTAFTRARPLDGFSGEFA